MIRLLVSICMLAAYSRTASSQPVDAGVPDVDAAPSWPTTEEPPRITHQDPPIYPDLPKAQQKVTDVLVHVEVDANGSLTDSRVISPANPKFDDLAIAAVSTWTFEPAKQNGRPVASHTSVTVHFDPNATAGNETITITDTKARGVERPRDRGASTFELTPSLMSKTAQSSPGKMLEQAPGLFLANEGGSGHADQVFLRGFDAEQGQDIEFTVGGVPINEVDNTDGHGYSDTHFIIPEVVRALRVTEGPFDPHQGDFAVAGSANYELGVVERGLQFEQTYGSFSTQRTLVLWAPPNEREGTFGAAQVTNTAGFGVNRASTAASAMSQYEGELGERGLWRVLAMVYATHYKSAGVIRGTDVTSGKIDYFGTEDPSQGGDAQRYSLSFELEKPIDRTSEVKQQVFLTYRTMHITEDFTGFLLDDPQPGQSFHPQRGDAIEQDYTALTLGARGSYQLKGSLLGQDQTIELGYYGRFDHTLPEIQRLRFGSTIPYLIDSDLVTDVLNVAPYVDLDLKPFAWLSLRGGVRQEFFSYDVTNLCATDGGYQRGQPLDVLCPSYDTAGPRQNTSQISATGVISEPKVSAVAKLPGGLSLSASYGVGAQSLDAAYLTNNQNAPFSTLHAAEGGAIYHLATDDLELTGRVVGYYTHVDSDLIFDPLLGRLASSTGTTRRGAVIAAHLATPWLHELASATYAYATYDQDHTLVPYVPSLIARSDTSVVHAIPNVAIDDSPVIGSLGLGLNYVGTRALPLGQESQPTFTIDASAGARWRWLKLGVQIQNLLDRRYPLTEYFYASDFHQGPAYATLAPTLNYTVAPPFTVLFTLGLAFDGGVHK